LGKGDYEGTDIDPLSSYSLEHQNDVAFLSTKVSAEVYDRAIVFAPTVPEDNHKDKGLVGWPSKVTPLEIFPQGNPERYSINQPWIDNTFFGVCISFRHPTPPYPHYSSLELI